MRTRIAALIAFVSFVGSVVAAQDRTVVLVHGLHSSAATWDQAAARLAARLAIQPLQTSTDWKAPYEFQATDLEQKIGGQSPPDSIAIGHSNGGVIARQWSRNRNVGGIITLGSPNQGAPIVDHIFDWLRFLDEFLVRKSNVATFFANFVDHDTWWWLPAQWSGSFSFAFDIWNTANNGLLNLGFDYRLPVMPEMRVASAFMANINSQANRDREAAAVGTRAAIVNVAKDFDHGGPFRLIAPANYDTWRDGIFAAGLGLEGLAGIIRITADLQDQAAFDLADQLSFFAEGFLQFEEVWCRTVSDPSPIPLGRCIEHDGIVPAWSQAYDFPRLPLIVRIDGPTHTEETANSDEQLYQALTTIARVPPRQVSPPTASPVQGPPPSPTPTGRYKQIGSQCVWTPSESGPDQCSPLPPSGRYKFDGWGTCYWEPNDYPPDQCSPPAPITGRYKSDGHGGCYWDANDSGPNQCVP